MGANQKSSKTKVHAKARTPEARELQISALAYDEAERRIRDGTATSQLLTHFLKVGAAKAVYETELLKQEVKLKKAKTESIESAKDLGEMMTEAMNAFKTYSGQDNEEEL